MEVHEIRAEMVHELGCKIEDMLEAAKLEVARSEGSKNAMLVAGKELNEVVNLVNKDLDSGVFNNLNEPLAIAGLIKGYLSRVSKILETIALNSDGYKLQIQGRIQAFDSITNNFKKIHELENNQAKLRKANLNGDALPVHRTTGVAPDLPIKERRKLELEQETKPEAENFDKQVISEEPQISNNKNRSAKQKPTKVKA